MRVVLLVGAGASYGAFDDESHRPPLGDQLFAHLVRFFPETWGKLPEQMQSEFRKPADGFELGMSALREDGKHTQKALIDLGTFFERFRIPSGINRYIALAARLESLGPNVEYAFASLNYETCLEQSLTQSDKTCFYWDDPPKGPARFYVRVVKPHGSCNFVVDTGTNMFFNNSFEIVGIYVGGSGCRLKVVPLEEVASAAKTGFPSAMSVYASGKPDMICPDFVARLRTDWREIVAVADMVVVIGARSNIASDPHIWQPIVEGKAMIAYIGGHELSLQEFVGSRLTYLGNTFQGGLDPLKDWLVGLGRSTE